MNRDRGITLLAFAIALLLVAGWFIRHALLLIYVSAIFAVVLKPGIDWLHRTSIFGWRPGRGAALLLIVAVLCIVLGVLIAIALPIVANATEFAGSMTGAFHISLLASAIISGSGGAQWSPPT